MTKEETIKSMLDILENPIYLACEIKDWEELDKALYKIYSLFIEPLQKENEELKNSLKRSPD